MAKHLAIAALALILWACDPTPTEPPVSEVPSKRIALTYDDAPLGDGPMLTGTERTERFIAELARADIPSATIFVTTKGMDAPGGHARVEAYANAGHLIANHSHDHGWSSGLQPEAFGAEVDKAEAKLRGLANRRAWFRFPFLDEGQYLTGDENASRDTIVAARTQRRDAFREELAQRGLLNAYVTADTFDWHLDFLWRAAVARDDAVDMGALEAIYVAMVVDAAEHADLLSRDTLGRQAAQVLLLHENDLAAYFTDEAVAGLRAAGWTIVSADEAFSDPISDVAPDTLFAGRGRIAAIAVDAGADMDNRFTHWSADRKMMEARVAEAGVFGE